MTAPDLRVGSVPTEALIEILDRFERGEQVVVVAPSRLSAENLAYLAMSSMCALPASLRQRSGGPQILRTEGPGCIDFVSLDATSATVVEGRRFDAVLWFVNPDDHVDLPLVEALDNFVNKNVYLHTPAAVL